MTPARAEWLLDQMLHAWLLDIEAVPYPVVKPPEDR